jgi:carbon starvation protein CstA
LGVVGAILAMLGVVAAPITSGDTAFRSARLIVAEWLKMNQRPIAKRLMICIPMFGVSIAMLVWQIENPDGFNTIWQYFGWSNQALSVFTLWTLTVYLVRNKKCFWVTLTPALLMTTVCSTYFFVSKQMLGLNDTGYIFGLVCLVVACIWFVLWYLKEIKIIK